MMIYREAEKEDIAQMQLVRRAVKENRLSNPDLVKDKDYEAFIHERGKGWVCTINNEVAGFAFVDTKEHNIWALFVHPGHEKKGIGKKLHQLMMSWYFSQTQQTVWLGTAPGTRAEEFYRQQGWAYKGALNATEVKFEMTFADWKNSPANRYPAG